MTTAQARFAYTALDRGGRTRAGFVEAASGTEATARLRTQDLFPVSVSPAGDAGSATPAPSETGPDTGSALRLGGQDAEQFFRLVARMLGAGVPLERSLGIIAAGKGDRASRLAQAVRTDLRAGLPPSRAVARHPAVFDAPLVALVRAGEASGQMAGAFEEIEKLVTRRNRLRHQLLAASLYPAILLAVATLCVLLILLFVIPKFEQLASDSATVMPLAAQAVFGASALAQALGPFLAVVAALVVGAAAVRVRSGRLDGDLISLAGSLPKIGATVRLAQVARLCRILGTLLSRNVSLLAAVETAASADPGPLGDGLREARARLRDGATFSAALGATGYFPTVVLQMAQIGEETGAVGTMLSQAAEILEEQVERAAKQNLILFQPIILIVLGLIIGALLYGLFSAILAINQSIL